MSNVIEFAYEARSLEHRVRTTVDQVRKLSAEDVASYIVQLEMRLEALGDRAHFEDNVEPEQPS